MKFPLLALWVWCASPCSTLAQSRAALTVSGNLTDASECGGKIDAAATINAALNSGQPRVVLPGCQLRAAATINVPNGVALEGSSFNPGNPSSGGSAILCDAGVSPCVQGGHENGQVSIRRLFIDRAGGEPAPGLIGLEIVDAYNATIEDVMVHNHGVGYYFRSHPVSGYGLGAMMTRVYSGAISDAHIVMDGWPELRIAQSRFGMNGAGDYASKTYIRMQGGVPGPGGPNTLAITNSHFNSGSTPTFHFLELVGLNAAGIPALDAGEINIADSHLENFSPNGAIFYSDDTWNWIQRVNFHHNTVSAPSTPLFALNTATEFDTVFFEGNIFYNSTCNLHPTSQINDLRIISNHFGCSVSIFGGGTGNFNGAIIQANVFTKGLSIAGGWGALAVGPNIYQGGVLTRNVTGKVLVNEPQFQSLAQQQQDRAPAERRVVSPDH